MSAAHTQWHALAQALAQWQDGQLRCDDFCAQARSASDLLHALPPRYSAVLHELLDRLQAGAAFSEESCSFSQQALCQLLQEWLEQAQLQLPAASA